MALKGLATGIGSLPFMEAEAALDLIFRHVGEAPFWPQLPKRGFREQMVAQFSEGLPCLRQTPEGVSFVSENSERELEVFYEHIIEGNPDYFRISQDYALGLYALYNRLKTINIDKVRFIKCHITGPFTFAASIKNEKGISLLHDPVFMQVIIKSLIMKALWQIRFFEGFGKKIIMFVDEPYLGCFGSAYTPINREEVIKGLSELTEGIKSERVLTGVHCCGNTDWSIFTDVNTFDIINFDAFSFLDKVILYADAIKVFLEKGGMLCWGIVPTQDFPAVPLLDSLMKKIVSGVELFEKKGLSKELIFRDMLLSPSCGLGTLPEEEAVKVFSLLEEFSLAVKSLQ